MGSSDSKTAETTGTANNSVIINGQVSVFGIEIIVLLGIICALKIIEFIYFIYNKYYQRMKKRFVDQPRQVQQA